MTAGIKAIKERLAPWLNIHLWINIMESIKDGMWYDISYNKNWIRRHREMYRHKNSTNYNRQRVNRIKKLFSHSPS